MNAPVKQEKIEATNTLREVVVSYPETVAASHKEILRLKSMLIGAREVIEEKEGEIESLQLQVDNFEEEDRDAEREADESLVQHVDRLLDECERVGVRRYRVPETDRVNDAILALHDVARRSA